MHQWKRVFGCSVFLFVVGASLGDSFFVDATADGTGDGSSWEQAKKTIQAGVDLAMDGDTVWVADGIYFMATPVVITNGIHLESVGGPESTTVNGDGASSCFILGNSTCVVSGFCIANGVTNYTTEGSDIAGNGGGVACSGTQPVVTNCVFVGNRAATYGGGMYMGTARNCVFRDNTAQKGGGQFGGTAWNCTFIANTASDGGGGRASGSAFDCTFSENSTVYYGGGMAGGLASNCCFEANSAGFGGGMYAGVANRCFFRFNQANSGGGIEQGKASSSVFSANQALFGGGGMSGGEATQCTFSGNRAHYGGGMRSGTVSNSILWHNYAELSGTDLYGTLATYCCSPDVVHGVDGCITNNPQLVTDSHIGGTSPCISAGQASSVVDVDIDGEAWAIPPSMGCDEYVGHEPMGEPVFLSLQGATNFATGYAIEFQVVIQGVASESMVDFGDGASATNILGRISHQWRDPGDYAVVLSVMNGAMAGYARCTQSVHVVSSDESMVYVSPHGSAQNDGCSWLSAKGTIQGGVDAQGVLGGVIMVGNGTYLVGSAIKVAKGVRIKSAAGAESTIIDGNGASRCFDLGSSTCSIDGFTIQNGYTISSGGGVFCYGCVPEILNCVLIGNYAKYSGGALYGGRAENCLFVENASKAGGAQRSGIAQNCTFSGNVATSGEAVFVGRLSNCISWPDSVSGNPLVTNACCFNDPIFGSTNTGDYGLTAESPCIDAGIAAFSTQVEDLAGSPRIFGGSIDLGAFEFPVTRNTPVAVPTQWMVEHGFSGDSDALDDQDEDGMITWEEYVAGTLPSDPESFFRVGIAGDATRYVVSWFPSITGRKYFVQGTDNLMDSFHTLVEVDFTDGSWTNNMLDPLGFVRIQVELE
ncbi:choice-of-anchor Q domain-containing protein [Pontiella sp.]|uniref:choice-of-anchor Q domain-containing protein n=1 Tax=Pontiella sp. TaxID=2837462 RepID=UPI0035678D17